MKRPERLEERMEFLWRLGNGEGQELVHINLGVIDSHWCSHCVQIREKHEEDEEDENEDENEDDGHDGVCEHAGAQRLRVERVTPRDA